ncbi:outer membrane protein with beta-barrel domain [Chitinophaga skermanii]|uniref:Outer membrane protein with beta-barrel domain n=1 Tax=Chitinophaga skermanii TaxID=331697 RepID=A0A327QCE5_9BACT|nr:outer membrane beta-barrel protein [Chitinophaga skermanii]RAJ01645.1 outer membrane protein with beta-barrel domain [Chitinophaga skermanii]
MKKLIFTLCLLGVTYGLFAQENTGAAGAIMTKATQSKGISRDFLMIQLSYDGWASTPTDVNTKGLSRGFNMYFMYDFPIKKTNLSVAAGLGVGSSNVFLRNQKIDMQNTSSTVKFVATDEYKKYKVSTTYLDIPLELRYYSDKENANKGFKAALGVKVGTLLNAHTKGKNSLGGDRNIIKEQNKRYFNSWRYAGTARIGYGPVGLFGTYSFSKLFKDNSGLDITPYSVGIYLSGL